MTNIFIDIYDITIDIHQYIHQTHRPNGAAAEGGRPIGGAAEGGASVFFVSAHLSFYIMNSYGYSLYIPYIFHIYIYIW